MVINLNHAMNQVVARCGRVDLASKLWIYIIDWYDCFIWPKYFCMGTRQDLHRFLIFFVRRQKAGLLTASLGLKKQLKRCFMCLKAPRI